RIVVIKGRWRALLGLLTGHVLLRLVMTIPCRSGVPRMGSHRMSIEVTVVAFIVLLGLLMGNVLPLLAGMAQCKSGMWVRAAMFRPILGIKGMLCLIWTGRERLV